MADDRAHRGRPGVGDVFVSYSRADRDAALRLVAGLRQQGRRVWVDWEGIPPTAEWMAEIRTGIESADAVVFILSPDSLRSRVCSDELAFALDRNKRVVPVVVKDITGQSVPEPLAKLQWVSARTGDDAGVLDALAAGLDTDLDRVRLHTRLTVRAAEWLASGRDPQARLRGRELEAARGLVADDDRQPAATDAQVEFVAASSRFARTRWTAGLLLLAAAAAQLPLLSDRLLDAAAAAGGLGWQGRLYGAGIVLLTCSTIAVAAAAVLTLAEIVDLTTRVAWTGLALGTAVVVIDVVGELRGDVRAGEALSVHAVLTALWHATGYGDGAVVFPVGPAIFGLAVSLVLIVGALFVLRRGWRAGVRPTREVGRG